MFFLYKTDMFVEHVCFEVVVYQLFGPDPVALLVFERGGLAVHHLPLVREEAGRVHDARLRARVDHGIVGPLQPVDVDVGGGRNFAEIQRDSTAHHGKNHGHEIRRHDFEDCNLDFGNGMNLDCDFCCNFVDEVWMV